MVLASSTARGMRSLMYTILKTVIPATQQKKRDQLNLATQPGQWPMTSVPRGSACTTAADPNKPPPKRCAPPSHRSRPRTPCTALKDIDMTIDTSRPSILNTTTLHIQFEARISSIINQQKQKCNIVHHSVQFSAFCIFVQTFLYRPASPAPAGLSPGVRCNDLDNDQRTPHNQCAFRPIQ